MHSELRGIADALNRWLFDDALPLWWRTGADHEQGGFHELIGLDGLAVRVPRRARVQARQSYVYALAGRLGWTGTWEKAAQHGLDYLDEKYARGDGFYCTLVDASGAQSDKTAKLYDQAFVLLAMAWVSTMCPERAQLRVRAAELRARITGSWRNAAGGFIENDRVHFQSNPHMHLFEASLAWGEFAPDAEWDGLTDEIAELALAHFIDSRKGCLREFFDESWKPLQSPAGRVVEPGHQFEWAWLMARWGSMRGNERAIAAAHKLYAIGNLGIDSRRHAAVDEMNDDFAVTRASARLWPQTERLKAALILAEKATGDERARFTGEAVDAARTLQTYFDTPVRGLWRDKWQEDGSFVQEPAPASSFYHIACAIAALKEAADRQT